MDRADRPEKTLADYVAIAISPTLIMALVGSLVYFLLEIAYVGQFYGSLRWVLFFFVFGAVLVSRISMEADTADRAPLYGLVLGALMWFALQRYVEYPPDSAVGEWGWAINLGLIVLIWWSAHRLTKDCTLIDDSVDASGAGLLEMAGLEKGNGPGASAAGDAEQKETKTKKRKPARGLAGWWQRYREYRAERKRRPQAPGVWVVYFSLAALPLFGLGQSQIPPEDTERRAYTFWLLCIYVGSGLGLLLTTSFLGLRRYLRQRKLNMPAAMTGTWMLLGALFVGAFLLVGGILPRPGDPTPLLEWAGLASSTPRKASEHAQVGDPGDDKGRGAPKRGGKDDDKEGGKDGKNAKDPDKKDKAAGKEDDSGSGSSAKKGDARAQGKGKRGNNSDQREQDRNAEQEKRADSSDSSFWRDLAKVLKWVVIAILIVIAAFVLIRGLLRFLANFTKWAENLLKALQKWWDALWRRETAGAAAVAELEVVRQPPPFASFQNPFTSGAAVRMDPAELVRYSFAGLEAWAWQRHFGREVGETPFEFAHRIGDEAPALEADVRRLAEYYVALAYARQTMSTDCLEPLREFWQMLMEVHERPLSAGSRLEASRVEKEPA
jgi:hypothetical protein